MNSIEQYFSEENFLIGESVFDRGGVEEANKLKGNLWNVVVREDTLYEVEVKGFNTKSVKYTCDCDKFENTKECQHIVASLLHIRKHTKVVTVDKFTPKKVKTYNIKSILDHLDREDLALFIRQATKRDRSLNYMFKAIFAPKIDTESNVEKYQDILQVLIKPVTTLGAKSTTSDIRLAIRVIKEFRDQLGDAISLEQYIEVFDIIKGTFSRLHYLYRNYPSCRDQIDPIIKLYNRYIAEMYKGNLAPALLVQLDEVVSQVATLSYYNYLDLKQEVAYTLYKYNRTKATDLVKDHLEDQSLARTTDREQPVVAALNILLANENKNLKLLTDQQKIDISSILVDWGENEKAVAYLEGLISPKERNRALEYALIELYFQLDMMQKGYDLSIDLFVTSRELRFLRQMKKANDGILSEKVKSKISKKLAAVKGQHLFKGMYYKEIDDTDNLIAVLTDSLDLQIIMQHDAFLYNNDYVGLEELYKKAIANYQKTFVGNKAQSFMQEINHHLTDINAFKLQSALSYVFDSESNVGNHKW